MSNSRNPPFKPTHSITINTSLSSTRNPTPLTQFTPSLNTLSNPSYTQHYPLAATIPTKQIDPHYVQPSQTYYNPSVPTYRPVVIHNTRRGHGRSNGIGRPICQVCSKIGNTAVQCYHRYNSNYNGTSPQYNPSPQQICARSYLTSGSQAPIISGHNYLKSPNSSILP